MPQNYNNIQYTIFSILPQLEAIVKVRQNKLMVLSYKGKTRSIIHVRG